MSLRAAPSTRPARQLWYAPLLAIAMGLMMVRLLIMAQLLDLNAFAAFSGGLLVSGTFCMLGCFGLQTLLQRSWPVNLVLGQELRGVVLAMQCVLVATACGVVVLLFPLVGITPAGMLPATLAVGLLHGLAQQVFLVATVESRSRGESVRFAWQNLSRAILALAAGSLVATTTGSAWGALLVDAVISTLLSFEYLRTSIARARLGAAALFVVALHRLPVLPWRTSFTLMAIMIVAFSLLNLDRWIAAEVLPASGFAHYAFAWIVLSIGQSTQSVINASVFPAMARRYAQGGRQAALRLCARASLSVLGVGAVLFFPMGYLAIAGIRHAYPQYAQSTELIPLFILVAVLRVSDFWSSYLLVTGSERGLLGINVVSAGVGVAAWATLTLGMTQTPRLAEIGLIPVFMTVAAYAAVGTLSWLRR